jgi:two-component system cell cycle response regulator CtrA
MTPFRQNLTPESCSLMFAALPTAAFGATMRVLLVENDSVSAKLIDAALKAEGIVCEPAESGEDAIDLVKHYDFQAMILDARLPDIDGFEVLRRIRAAKVRTPVLFLSDTNETDDKIRALATGADDYLTKPLHKGELIARIHAIVRRSKGHSETAIKTGKLVVNLDKHSVEVDGRQLHVTAMEYSILELLSLRKGTTLTKEMLLDHLYGGIDEPKIKIIDFFISKLRKKISAATGGHHYIETVWGRGYVLKDTGSYFSPDEKRASELTDDAIAIIDLRLRAREMPRYVLSYDDLELIARMRVQVSIVKLLIHADSTIWNDVEIVEPQLKQLNRLAMTLYQVVLVKTEELKVNQEARTVENHIIAGNVVRNAGSGSFKGGKFRTDPWISGQEFSGDSFKAIADLAKCLQHSETFTRKALCNLAFVVEILRTMASVVSQLIPFAAKK